MSKVSASAVLAAIGAQHEMIDRRVPNDPTGQVKELHSVQLGSAKHSCAEAEKGVADALGTASRFHESFQSGRHPSVTGAAADEWSDVVGALKDAKEFGEKYFESLGDAQERMREFLRTSGEADEADELEIEVDEMDMKHGMKKKKKMEDETDEMAQFGMMGKKKKKAEK